jgi:hypothetical protein
LSVAYFLLSAIPGGEANSIGDERCNVDQVIARMPDCSVDPNQVLFSIRRASLEPRRTETQAKFWRKCLVLGTAFKARDQPHVALSSKLPLH